MFSHEVIISLASTDAAGVIYFAEQLRLAHEVYERFLESINYPLAEIIQSKIALPIVHCEADFFYPIFCGYRIDVQLSLHSKGRHSFTLQYEFIRTKKTLGKVLTTHVSIQKNTQKKVELPFQLIEGLK